MLLTFQQQQAYKPISQNNKNKFDQLLSEVENCEFRDLIGIALLQDLQANPTTTDNAKLLNGDSFDYNGNTVSHRGLRYVLAYLIHSKYIGEVYLTDTFSGIVKKKTEQSEPATEGEIRRLQEGSRKIALSEFEIIKEYLNSKSETFTKWACSEYKKPFTPRIYGIRKTAN